MEKNESMMIAASYFWSDTFNAFIFGHDPTFPTLVDILMLTGLDITTADDGGSFNRKTEYKVETRNIGVGRDMSRNIGRLDRLVRESMPSS